MYSLDNLEIVRLYDFGWSMQSLAKRYHVSHSVIKKRLLADGIKLRSISEAVKSMSLADPGIKDRTGRRRRYPLNVNCLDRLTPEAAYIIGLFQADGSITRRRVSITLKPSDAPLLENVARHMGTQRPLLPTRSPFGNGISLEISSVKLAAAFTRWGIRSPKCLPTHPSLLHNRDYWRGVIDGDGTLCVAATGRKILALVGSQQICSEFLGFCHSHGAGTRVNVITHKSIFSIHLNNSDALMIARILYEGASLALERKLAIYENHFA